LTETAVSAPDQCAADLQPFALLVSATILIYATVCLGRTGRAVDHQSFDPETDAAEVRIIRRINASGVTVLFVEQNVNQTLAIAYYGYALSQGKIAVQGKAPDLLADAEVQEGLFWCDPLKPDISAHCANSKA